MAVASRYKKQHDKQHIAVIGDGSMTAGMAFEALNHAGVENANLLVIDARPESRYAQSHLPGAVSISVEKMAKEMGAVLPKDKEQMLVFYCGGPT